MSIEDSIRDEIQYCEKKAIEYKNDAENKIGGKIDLWRGKSEVHEYMAVRLKRVLAWHESKPKN